MCCDALSLPSHHPLPPSSSVWIAGVSYAGGHVTDDWAGECDTHTSEFFPKTVLEAAHYK